MNAVRNHFKPEFLNRIDEIVVFHRLGEAHIERIVEHPGRAAADAAWPSGASGSSSPRRRWRTSPDVGYDPDFGARPLKRVIQREVGRPDRARRAQGRVPRRRHRRGRRHRRRHPDLQQQDRPNDRRVTVTGGGVLTGVGRVD